jgi:RsiW-degrading membrane proteinase PrsW (M82 family)
MKSALRVAGLAVLLMVAAAIDYFLIVPQGTFGPLSLWMLVSLAIIGGILSLVLFLIAVTLAARARHQRREVEMEELTRSPW